MFRQLSAGQPCGGVVEDFGLASRRAQDASAVDGRMFEGSSVADRDLLLALKCA